VLLFLRAVPTLLTTFLWSGTWSFVAPPYVLFVPYLALSGLLAAGCARLLVLRRPSATDWVPLLTLALCVAALFYHTLVYIAAFRVPVVTAWYLHAFAPVLAVLVGYGLAGLLAWPRLRGVLLLLLLYGFAFLPIAFGLDALFFAGCGERPSRFGYADYVPLLSCMSDLATVFWRLSVLSFPATSIALFAAGWVCLLVGVLAAARCLFRRD
jgi:hypothetical protein